MSMYQPSHLRRFLDASGMEAKKGLSQNFLIDGNILRKIIREASIEEGDLVLEIGPGPGALTEQLLEAGATVVAVEKDRGFAKALSERPEAGKTLFPLDSDILEVNLAELLEEHLQVGQRAKVVANLPYHLTTPILTGLVPLNKLFSLIVVMVQDEVGRRMSSKPGSKDYSSLSVFLEAYGQSRYAFRVGRNCFYPAPKVDSAIVAIALDEEGKELPEIFFEIVRKSFGHRRKMLRATLKDWSAPEETEAILESIGLSKLSRPENLSFQNFVKLVQAIEEKSF